MLLVLCFLTVACIKMVQLNYLRQHNVRADRSVSASSALIINELRIIDWKSNHNKVINTSYVAYNCNL